jgi:tetratricopeptide (TPR) repeat protein
MTRRSIANQIPALASPSVARKLREAYAAHQAGHADKAERLYSEVLRHRPNEFDALHLLGLLNYQRGRLPEALRLIGAALECNGRSVDAWSNLGMVLHAKGELEKALSSYEEALALKGDHPDVHNNRGNTLNSLGRRDAALQSFDRALAARPDYVAALYNRGTTLLDLSRHEEALASFDAALKSTPNHPESLCHRGNALLRLGRLAEAAASYALAANAAPNNALILHNHALALRHTGRPREALQRAEEALRLRPDYAPARFEQGMALLALGDLRRGFAAYEARWETNEFLPQRRDFSAPLWLGQDDLSGGTILLHAEQGFGDTLQFVRYVPLVACAGGKIVLEVQPELKPLLSGIAGALSVVARGEALPPFDLHCPLMSLPLAMHTELATIPANVPYLAADADKVAHWAARLSAYEGRRKVGLVWAGAPRPHDPNAKAIDARRSMSLQHFAPLADLADIQFFSLQKGEPSVEARQPPDGLPLIDFTADLHGFTDTAVLIANLDLVICVDTAVAHLTGALGKPVWVLSRFDACWRWLDGRDDSPWYPSARLFRQQAQGAWGDVVAHVRGALADWKFGI